MLKTFISEKEVSFDLEQELEILEQRGTSLVVRVGNKVQELTVHRTEDPKLLDVFLNGIHYPVRIKDRTDLLLEEMGMDMGASDAAADLKAPMPGLVLDVLVATGDTVSKGAPLLVLEAMKMENMIKATADATVEAINVSTGDTVEKDQLMITFKND